MSEGGFIDKTKGRLKEAAGSLLDDDELKRSGRADQTAGKAKEKAEEVVDKARDAVSGDDES
ncbi:MAG: CsbD family protein [Myxococcota bacterium]